MARHGMTDYRPPSRTAQFATVVATRWPETHNASRLRLVTPRGWLGDLIVYAVRFSQMPVNEKGAS